MFALLSLGAAFAGVPTGGVDTLFVPVHVAAFEEEAPRRAVVLVHGYWPGATRAMARTARLHDWQRPKSPLVAALGAVADVYSLGYGRGAPVGDIVAPVAAAVATVAGRSRHPRDRARTPRDGTLPTSEVDEETVAGLIGAVADLGPEPPLVVPIAR